MMHKVALILSFGLLVQFIACERVGDHVKTVFKTSCVLGEVQIIPTVSGGEWLSTISITPLAGVSAQTFFVQGELQGFQLYGRDLLLEFGDHLTIHTVVFSEDAGSVSKVFEHTSNMGCFLAELNIVCLSGTLAGADRAEIFTETSQPSRAYELKAAVPYRNLYPTLGQLDNPAP